MIKNKATVNTVSVFKGRNLFLKMIGPLQLTINCKALNIWKKMHDRRKLIMFKPLL